MLDLGFAYQTHGTLPLAGGYLDQPGQLMRDINRTLVIVARKGEEAREIAETASEALQSSAKPDVPLPKIPKELLVASRPGKTAA